MLDNKIAAIDTALNAIRKLALEKIGYQEAFSPLLLSMPGRGAVASTFLRLISCLYCAYYESGKVIFNALNGGNTHYTNVHLLRTYFQHGFDTKNSKRDQKYYEQVILWFSRACHREQEPEHHDESKWENCVDVILNESKEFLERCESKLSSMDPSGLDRLKYRISPHIPTHKLESILKNVLITFDLLKFIDHSKLTKTYEAEINLELRDKRPSDTDNFIRRFFEKYVAKEMPLPIDGDDIINSCGVPPSCKVRQCLKFARASMIKQPCGKDELLNRIIKTVL